MKNNTLIVCLIVLLVIICIALLGFMMKVINGKMGFPYKVSEELVVDEEYENNFETINITSDASDIEVKETSGEKVRVIIYGDKDKTEVEERNNELKIISKHKKGTWFAFRNKIAKIEVYVPKKFDKNITINNKYGDIDVEEFLEATIEINEDCGDVDIAGGNKVNIVNKYGDIKLKKAKDANIKQSAGEVKVESVDDIVVKNNYSDIKITNVYNSINAEEDCGDVKIDNLTINKDSNIKNNLGSIKIGSTNEIYIDAKTDLGDVKVNNNYQKSDITLKIENDCGDIKVNN